MHGAGKPRSAAAGRRSVCAYVSIEALPPMVTGATILLLRAIELAMNTAAARMQGWQGLLPVALIVLMVGSHTFRARSKDVHKRGARVLHHGRGRYARRRRRRLLSAAITLAGVPLTVAEETRHFKLIGTTGT